MAWNKTNGCSTATPSARRTTRPGAAETCPGPQKDITTPVQMRQGGSAGNEGSQSSSRPHSEATQQNLHFNSGDDHGPGTNVQQLCSTSKRDADSGTAELRPSKWPKEADASLLQFLKHSGAGDTSKKLSVPAKHGSSVPAAEAMDMLLKASACVNVAHPQVHSTALVIARRMRDLNKRFDGDFGKACAANTSNIRDSTKCPSCINFYDLLRQRNRSLLLAMQRMRWFSTLPPGECKASLQRYLKFAEPNVGAPPYVLLFWSCASYFNVLCISLVMCIQSMCRHFGDV